MSTIKIVFNLPSDGSKMRRRRMNRDRDVKEEKERLKTGRLNELRKSVTKMRTRIKIAGASVLKRHVHKLVTLLGQF